MERARATIASMIDREIVQKAVDLLLQACRPSRIILFGSVARGDSDEGSDLDLLVVLPEVHERRTEMVRLLEVLRPLHVPVDVLVYSEEYVEEWGHLPGTALYEALHEGRVVYDAA